jgi:hypothetical protein
MRLGIEDTRIFPYPFEDCENLERLDRLTLEREYIPCIKDLHC